MNSENLSAYIRQARLKAGYSTIRELWSKIAEKKAKQKEDWISYAYFQQIESSGRLPSIEDFLEIVNFLNLNEREACYLYARAIMPTNRTKSYFDLTLPPKPHEPIAYPQKTTRLEPDQVYELTSEQISFFALNPEAYEVALVLSDTNAKEINDIAKVASLSKTQTKKILDDLVKNGLATKEGNEFKFVKASLRISGNQSTKELQWQLFSRHLKRAHMKYFDPSCRNPKFRASIVSPLKAQDAELLLNELRQMTKKVDSLEVDPSDETQAYYLGVVFGPRFNEEDKG